ncbi:MAG: hypothetical protein R2873_13765 [Caldilineaceae bacterium]
MLQTKLYAPRRHRADWVTRPRLLDRLDASDTARLTLIAAPAGFGKTTLVSDWLARRGRDAAWLSLDSADADPVLFWRYVIAALQTRSPELGAEIAQLLQMPQSPPLEPLLARLINEIAQHQCDLLLILDDYHTVEDAQIDASLQFFIEHMPPNCRLVLTSRVDPNLPLARWRVRRDLVEIRADDLRFTADEAADFLARESGIVVPAAVVTALDTRTEGWIAGLQMAALSLQGNQDPAAFVDAFGGSHRYVMDYLTDEVLDRQPADVHAFLLKTSILDRCCADLCDAVLAADSTLAGQSRRLLAHLDRAHLFLTPLDDEGRWYRYHHLFADLLRRRLPQQPGLDVADLHRRAARWYVEHGSAGEAIQHFLAAEDVEAAADLVQAEGEGMLFRGEIQKLRVWVSALPRSVFVTRPLLSLGTCWIHYFRHEPDEAIPLLDLVDAYVASPTVTEAARRLWLGEASVLRGWVSHALGDTQSAIALLCRALDLLPEDEINYRGLASFFLGSLLLGVGEIDAGIQHTELGAELSRRVGNYTAYIGTQTILSTVENERGFAKAARRRLEETLAWLARQHLDQLPLGGDLYLSMGDLLYQANQVEAAVRCYTQARAIVESYLRQTRMLITLRLAWAHHHIRRGCPDDALAELRQIEDDVADRPASAELEETLIEAGALHLRLGNPAQARRWIGDVGAPLTEADITRQIVLARLWLVEGQAHSRPDRLGAAAALLNQLLVDQKAQRRNRRVAQVGILRALVSLAQGDPLVAADSLVTALAAVPVDDYAGIFLDDGEALRDLLAQIVADPRRQDVRAAAQTLLTLLAPAEPVTVQADDAAQIVTSSPDLADPSPSANWRRCASWPATFPPKRSPNVLSSPWVRYAHTPNAFTPSWMCIAG